MKLHTFLKRSIVLCILLILFSSSKLLAQIINPLPFIAGAESDINYLGGNYLNPAGTAINNALNNSWYSTADVHSLGGFHLNIAPSLIIVPAEGQSFEIKNNELQELELVNPQDNIAPTAFGENQEGPLLRSKALGNTQTFNTPPGVGFSFLPIAALNLGAGVGLNTEINLRYFPKSEIAGLENARLGLFGFGLMHEVSAWFFGEKPPVHISAMVGFNSISYDQPISGDSTSSDHSLEMRSQGITVRAIVSKKLSFLTVYGGVGFNNAEANIDLRGTYTYQTTPGSSMTVTDPISTTSKTSGMVANLGARVKMFRAVSFFADYTFAEYSSVTVGLGVDLNLK